MISSPKIEKADPYAALRYPGYRCFIAARLFYTLAVQMQTVAVSWQIYQRLRDNPVQAALALGYIGLVQVLPIVLFSLPAGQVADRFNRKTIMLATQLAFAVCALGTLVLSSLSAPVGYYYAVLFVGGMARAFITPAVSALITTLVPRQVFPNASTWNSTFFQTAAMLGPALGGLVVAMVGAHYSFFINILFAAVGFGFALFIRPLPGLAVARTPVTIDSLLTGIRFVFGSRLMLAMFSLDLFAVLLGGATALLPIYASDVLKVGASGYGILRAAPAVGAIGMALLTAHLRPWRRAGRTMLWAVAGYGAATLVFGLSKWFWLSVAALALTGVFDNVSVVIRQTLAQMLTPNELRGRVSAVSYVFISCSNELGEFESGITAGGLGPVGSVILGGLGTLLVVAGATKVFPELLRLGPLHDLKLVEIEKATSEQLDEAPRV